MQSNKRLEKKLPKGAEAASILVGQVAFLKEPIMALYRLSNAKVMGDWCEIATETRFVFLALSPKARGSTVWELSERGRAVAVLLGDKVIIISNVIIIPLWFTTRLTFRPPFDCNLTALRPLGNVTSVGAGCCTAT